MKQAKPHVTLLVGPQTRLARALNDIVRTRRRAIEKAGVLAVPNRVASRALRAASAESQDDNAWLAALEAALQLDDGRPVFLSAINFLGPPTAVYRGQELFPKAERIIAGHGSPLADVVSRIVLTVEPLHHFLLALKSPTLHHRVSVAPWETLYELSWSDLVSELSAAFPSSRVWVVTPDAAFVGADMMISEMFGAAATAIDPKILQRSQLTPEGQAALAKAGAKARPSAETLESLIAAHRDAPDRAELKKRIGIDKLTATLLDQRFQEDLHNIEKLPRVRLL